MFVVWVGDLKSYRLCEYDFFLAFQFPVNDTPVDRYTCQCIIFSLPEGSTLGQCKSSKTATTATELINCLFVTIDQTSKSIALLYGSLILVPANVLIALYIEQDKMTEKKKIYERVIDEEKKK